MWKAFFLCVGVLLLSACAASEAPQTAASVDEPYVRTEQPGSDPDLHTLSAELTMYEGGVAGARAFVSAQARQICDSVGQQVEIVDVVSQATWQGGSATVSFYCR